MHEARTAIMARAWEAVACFQGGDDDRARQALADGVERLERCELEAWWQTAVHAPLAAATWLAGDHERAEAHLAQARSGVGDESNPFQQRAVLVRALLAMGRTDEVRQLIDGEEASWVSPHHLGVLGDLVDAGALELLRHAWHHWAAGEEWEAPGILQRRLWAAGDLARATSLEWLDPELEADEEVIAEIEARAEGADPVAALAGAGRWEEVYALFDSTKRAHRNPLYAAAARAAVARGDLDVALDLLARLPCSDMNAPGVRELQQAFRAATFPWFREVHF
jgi:hypothetical protein